jgi:predicted transcriptional regulator of viral defense system
VLTLLSDTYTILCVPIRNATPEALLTRLARDRGVLRAGDLAERGIPRWALSRLVTRGDLVRVGRGLYRYAGAQPSEHHTLVEACTRVPKGVVFLLSALRFHNITTQLPREVWMALPNRYPPVVDYPAIRFHFLSGNAFRSGIEAHVIEKRDLRVYSAAKTVVDCFKFRNKIGIDIAIEALRDGLSSKKVNVDDLWRFARVCRMANVMRPYLEAVR